MKDEHGALLQSYRDAKSYVFGYMLYKCHFVHHKS